MRQLTVEVVSMVTIEVPDDYKDEVPFTMEAHPTEGAQPIVSCETIANKIVTDVPL